MTREEILLKSLAVEATTLDEIKVECGWPRGEAEVVLHELIRLGLVTWRNWGSKRLYYPAVAVPAFAGAAA